jgi:hypothetical protein
LNEDHPSYTWTCCEAIVPDRLWSHLTVAP